MEKYILICLLLMLGKLGFSQTNTTEQTKNCVGLQVGYNHGYLKDLNFSPLNYKEGGLLYALNYTNQNPNGKVILNVDIEFSSAQLKTKASDYLASNLIMANFETSFVRKVSKEKKLLIYIGGQYSSYLQIIDWQDYESFSFLASHGVGVKGLISYNLTAKHRFSSSLYIPVFQFLARPPYNGIDENIIENQDNIAKIIFNGKPVSFNQYLAFDWKINYLYSLSKRFDFSATYLLRYQNVSEINEVVHLQNQLSIGLKFKF